MKIGDTVLVSRDAPESPDGTSPAGLVSRITYVLVDSVGVRGLPLPVPRSSVRVCGAAPSSGTLLQEESASP